MKCHWTPDRIYNAHIRELSATRGVGRKGGKRVGQTSDLEQDIELRNGVKAEQNPKS